MKKFYYVAKENGKVFFHSSKGNSFKLSLLETLKLKWKGSCYLSVLENKYESDPVIEEKEVLPIIEEEQKSPTTESVLCSSLSFKLDLDLPLKLSSTSQFKKQKELGYKGGFITFQKPKDTSFSIVDQIGTLECVLNKDTEEFGVHPEMMSTATFYGLNVVLKKMCFEEMVELALKTNTNILIPESDYYINYVIELGFDVTPSKPFRLYKVW